MADLISRAAAIDAIVSVTAFLDAEYIKNLCQNPANSEDWLGGVCDAINAVEDVSAVGAVPVEWMRDKMRGYASSLKSTEMDAVVRVLSMWEKEQEAQNE
jgi:hypothetical protein